jgi:hypothetical protein
MCLGSNSQTVVQANELPSWVTNQAQANLNEANNLASRPYTPYTGTRVAPFSADTMNAWNLTRQNVGNWKDMFAQATGGASDVLGASPNANVEAFLNPMQSYITDEIARQGAIARKGINAAATNAGAFDSARHGVVEGMQREGEARAIGQTMAGAYTTAQDMAMRDTANRLAAAGMLGQLGTTGQQMDMRDAAALEAIGGAQEGKSQQNLDVAYQNFLDQLNWPVEMLNLRMAALSGSPYSTTRTSTGPGANTFAQNLGAFASLAGGLGSLGGSGGLGGLVNTVSSWF